jgi:hypothetical protein
MKLAAALLALCPLACLAQSPLQEQEIQRAIIQLDQRSADFARGTTSPLMDPFVGRSLSPDPDIARQMRPYERMKAAEARDANVLQLPPPVVRNEVRDAARKEEKPLPLPGGPRGALEPNPITSPRPSD